MEEYMTESNEKISDEDLEEELTELPEDSESAAIEDETADPDEEIDPQPEDFEPTVESVVEAVLFASDEPLSVQRLVNIVEAGSISQVRDCVKKLNEKYRSNNSAFRIEKIAGGYQIMTLDVFSYWLKKLVRVRTETKLSQAALETLAIISYKQPVIRADIEAIRGVAAGEVIRNLMYKGLVKIVGRAEVLGRPMLYGTTKKFLDIFGLNTLKDLPKIEELKKPEQ
jgi:segregation and condensation protein B